MIAADRSAILATSRQLIEAHAQTVTRRRLDTSQVPASYDPDYGEAADKTQETWENLELPAAIFDSPGERALLKSFGEFVECEVLVHVPGDADVLAGDTIGIRGVNYRITRYRKAPLGGFIALALSRKEAQ
jgi:hypothetical protein